MNENTLFEDWKSFCFALRLIASGANGIPLDAREAQRLAQTVLQKCGYSWPALLEELRLNPNRKAIVANVKSNNKSSWQDLVSVLHEMNEQPPPKRANGSKTWAARVPRKRSAPNLEQQPRHHPILDARAFPVIRQRGPATTQAGPESAR